MIHQIIQYLKFIVFAVLLYAFLIRRYKHLSKRMKAILIFVFSVGLLFVAFFPLEAVIISFDTPEEAFYYSHFDQQIYNIINYNGCAIILSGSSKDGRDNDLSIIYNSNGKWHIENPYAFLFVEQYSYGKVSIYRILLNKCFTQFVLCTEIVISGEELKNITDSEHSTFEVFEQYYPQKTYHMKYHYVFIDYQTDNYSISVDDFTIQLKQIN